MSSNSTSRKAFLTAFAVFIAGMFPIMAQTTNLIWDPSNTGTDGAGAWNTTSLIWTNTVDGGTDIAWRNSANDIAIFGVGNGAAGVVTASGTLTNGGITFNAPGSGNYVVTGGTLYLGGPISVNNDSTIGSILAGASGLTKSGPNTLTITNPANAISGGVTVSLGTMTVKVPSAANGTVNCGTLGLSPTVTVNSGATLFVDDTGNGTSAGERDLTVTNAVSGSGTILVRGANTHNFDTVVLSGNLSTFTGSVVVTTNANLDGKLKFAAPSQAAVLSPSASISISNGTAIYLNQAFDFGSTFHLYGAANVENLGQIRLEGSARVTNSVVLHNNSFIGGNNGLISAIISETGGSFGFTKVAGGTLTNSGLNTYSGKTVINAGTVSAGIINNSGNAGNLGQNSTIDINGGTLQYTGPGEVTDRIINMAGTTGGAGINNLGTGLLKFTSNLTATNTGTGNKTLTLNGTTGNGEISGTITNGLGGQVYLTKTGTNTWTLSAATNYFTGQLQVTGGTLVWNTGAALAPAGGNFQPLNITGGGTLIVNGPLRYTSGTTGANGYLNIGSSAAGSTGTILINSGGSLTFTNQTSNPNSIIGQQTAGVVSKLNVNGGTFNWDGTGGLIVGNSGGSGLLLITNGGTATILKGTGSPEEGWIMMGRDSATSTGTVYLATGTLATSRIFVRDGSAGAGAGIANFTFDGGKLQALANQTDWLQSSDSGNNLTLTAVTIADGGAKVDANGFSVAINNNLLHGGVAATDGGLTKLGLGTLTLGSSSDTFTGPTVISNGVLAVTGGLPSGSAVTVAGGKLTVSGNVSGSVTVLPGGAIGASSGSFSSLVTLNAGNAAINLTDGTATTTTFNNGLTLNDGNVLTFELGSSADQIYVPATFTHNGTATINLAAISGISATTYTLVSDVASDITVTNGFVLGTVPSGYGATLAASGGALIVTLVQNVPSVAYWKGDVDNKWNTVSGGNNSNWATDSTGATDTGVPPSTPTAVTFAATGAANFNTVLGADLAINTLTLSTATNVTIGGTTNTLTLIGGLLNDTTALTNLISVSNVVLGSSQTWQNNSANALTVSSTISGSGLTIGGTGTIVLANTNNNFAGTTISSGTLQLGDASASNGSVAGDIVDNSTVAFGNATAQTYPGTISGSGQVTKLGAGTLTLSGSSTYSGSTTVSNGTLVIFGASGASTGTVNVNSGATFVCRPQTTTVYGNTVTGTGLVKLLFGDEGLGYNATGDWFTYLDNLSGFTGTIQLSTTTSTNVDKWDVGSTVVSGTSSLIIDSGAQLLLTNGNSLTFSAIQVSGSGNYQNRGAVRAAPGTLTGAMSLLADTTFGTEGGTIAGTIASGVAGAQTLTLGGASDLGGNITISADIGGGTGSIALRKINTGTTTLSGNNTYTGVTTNGAGTLDLANGSALQNSTLFNAAVLQFDGAVSSNAFVFGGLSGTSDITLASTYGGAITLTLGNNNSDAAYSGNLSDNGLASSLVKVGSGTQTFSGGNSYSGTTTVAAGKLVLNTVQTNVTAGIAVNDGATLTVNIASTNQLAPTAYTLGSVSGPVTNEFSGVTSTTVAPVNAGTVTLNGTATVNVLGGTFVGGASYPLIAYTSIGGTGGFTLGTLPRGLTATLATNGNTIVLSVISYIPITDVWSGSVNTNWDVGVTANWLTNGIATVYINGDVARFDDTAVSTNVFVTTALTPSATIVSNVSKTFTFTGSAISGSGTLTKRGAGILVLGQVNAYGGNTIISNGTVQLGVANAIPGGAGKGDVILNGTLDLNTSSESINGLSGSGTVDTVAGGTPTLSVGTSGSSSTFNGVLQNTAGALALTKIGNGTLTLGGNNTYSGATTVSAGTVKLASATALGSTAGATTVSSNAVLDLNGQAIAENINPRSGAAIVNNSASPAAVSGNVTADNSSFTTIGGIGDITFATITHASGSAQFDVTNVNTGTVDLAGTVDNGYLNMHVAAGTVILDKSGAVGQRATSALYVEGGTAKLGGSTGDQIYDANPITMTAGTFDLNGHNETIGNLVAAPGSTGVVLNNAAGTTNTLTIGGLNAVGADFYGNIADGAGVVALTKTGTGTSQTLDGVNTYSGPTTIANGTLTLTGDSGISNSVLVSVAGILNAANRNDGTLSLTSVQTLTGTGTNNGNLNALVGSVVNPGAINGIGTLTVAGNATLAGKLVLELNRTNTPSNCDHLVITGTPTYGGTLIVTNIGQTLQVGDAFQLFSSAVSGFGSINIATNDATGYKYTWNNNIGVDGSISVASVTSPVALNPTNISFSVSGNVLTLSWPADHLGWHLQIQTNSLSTGLGTNWVTLPGSDAVTSTNLTVNPANGTVFYRMVYP